MLRRLKHRLQRPYEYFLFRAEALRLGLQERTRKNGTGAAVPPPLLRYRVHADFDSDSYLRVGQMCAQSLKDLLASVGKEFSSFHHVLDFGCGSGRTLRCFEDRSGSCRLHGTDIDTQAIDWCKRHLDIASWSTNNPWPPLAYADRTFDFIYAISVFTHLDEEMQFAWLEELKRISKPDAVLILTVHGERHQSELPPEVRAYISEKGFLFGKDPVGMFKRDGLPEFYQVTFHSRAYIEERWSRLFKVLGYVECGVAYAHDAVILQNR